MVNVSGLLLISGADSTVYDSGIYAESDSSGKGGNASNIMLSAASLTLEAGGTISSTTAGLGKAGDISVTVSGTVLISGEDSMLLRSLPKGAMQATSCSQPAP